MTDWLLTACAFAAILLLARHLHWFIAVSQAGLHRGWRTVFQELNEPRETVQWRLRLETLALCGMAGMAWFGWPAGSLALLFWLLGCRIIRYAEMRDNAWLALIVLLGLSAFVSKGGLT